MASKNTSPLSRTQLRKSVSTLFCLATTRLPRQIEQIEVKWWVTCCSSAVWQHLASRYDASNSTHWWFSSQCCLLFLAHSRAVSDSDRPLHKLQTHTWSSDCSNWVVFSRFFYHSRLSFTRLAQWGPKGFCLLIGRLHFRLTLFAKCFCIVTLFLLLEWCTT